MSLRKIIYGTTVFLLTLSSNLWACSVCFLGTEKNLANTALRAGVLTLLIIVVAVLASFAKFFLNVRRRSHLMS